MEPDRYADLNERLDARLDRDAEVEPPRAARRFERFVCPVSHAAAKYDPAIWASMTPGGVQVVPDDEDGPGYSLALATCSCGTTLSKLIETAACEAA